MAKQRNIVSYGRDSKIDRRRSLAIFTRAEGGKGERERNSSKDANVCSELGVSAGAGRHTQTARVYPPNDRGDRHAQ